MATVVCDDHDGDLAQVLDFAGDTPNPVEEVRRDFVDFVCGHERDGFCIQRWKG